MSAPPAPLPAPLTRFIGRERELAELADLAQRVRLLTLTGLGGSGKTRLALAIVARLPLAPSDVAFVDLAPLANDTLVPATVLRTLGLREQADRSPTEIAGAALESRRFVLLLDNAERLLAPCAALVVELLDRCPLLSILVTSRERLGVAGEQVYEVAPLPAPEKDAPPEAAAAVQLFLDRARARVPGLSLSPAQLGTLAETCRRLDCLPLAIELAAARVAMLTIDEIAARLAERFELLVNTDRNAPPRQRTLRATLDWSFALLSEPERSVFLRASIFPGAFTLEAAEAVCADDALPAQAVLDLLARLGDQSLVQVDRSGAVARYRLLETVRLYARERLTAAGQAGPVLARHAAYFLVLADRGAALSLSQERIAWLDRLEAHIDDLRQAMQWLLDARASEAALRLAAALLQLCWVRGYMSEGRRWLQAALAESARVAPLVRAAALRAEGQLAYAQGDFAAARLVLQASIAQFEELGEEAGAHAPRLMLGAVYWEQGRFDESRALYETILANARRREDHVRAAEALVHVGLAALGQGQFAQSRAAIAEALGLYGRLGLREQMYIGLGNLGALAHAEGNLVEARGYYEAALAGLEETGFQLAAAAQLDRLAEVARREGQLDRAWAFIERSLQLRARLAARAGIAEGLATAGMIAAAAGEPERAARLLGAAEARRQQIGMALLCFYQEEHDRLVTALRNRIGANRLAGYWAEGAALSQEAALALVERPLRARGGAAVPLDQGRLDIRVLDLTEREREVLRLVAADRSNKEIGRALGLSVRTVEQHLRNVYAKLDVQGRAGATAVALRLGLVSTPRPGQTLLP